MLLEAYEWARTRTCPEGHNALLCSSAYVIVRTVKDKLSEIVAVHRYPGKVPAFGGIALRLICFPPEALLPCCIVSSLSLAEMMRDSMETRR